MRLLAFEVISLLRRVAADGALERRDLAHVICKLRRDNEARLDEWREDDKMPAVWGCAEQT